MPRPTTAAWRASFVGTQPREARSCKLLGNSLQPSFLLKTLFIGSTGAFNYPLPASLPKSLFQELVLEPNKGVRVHVAPRDTPVRARRRLQPGSIHVAACWKPSKPWAPGVAPVGGGSPAKDGGGERQAAVRGDPAQGRRGVHGVVGTRWHVGLASWLARADAAALFASYSPRHGRASDGARADGARITAITSAGSRASRAPLLRASAARVLT